MIGANAAAILGVTVMFWHGKLHTLVIQSTMLAGTYSIDEVCNFPCQNMTVRPKIAATFALHITHVSNANAPFELANATFQT